jgi:hypothetical protein
MRLSEAISLGAMSSPQTSHCAWAAAFDAVGHSSTTIYKYDEWKWTWRTIKCPGCKVAGRVADMIVHLNDAHRWSRSRIAEWVSMVEPWKKPRPRARNFH